MLSMKQSLGVCTAQTQRVSNETSFAFYVLEQTAELYSRLEEKNCLINTIDQYNSVHIFVWRRQLQQFQS